MIDDQKPSNHNRHTPSDFNRNTPSDFNRHTPSIAEVNKFPSGVINNEPQKTYVTGEF